MLKRNPIGGDNHIDPNFQQPKKKERENEMKTKDQRSDQS